MTAAIEFMPLSIRPDRPAPPVPMPYGKFVPQYRPNARTERAILASSTFRPHSRARISPISEGRPTFVISP